MNHPLPLQAVLVPKSVPPPLTTFPHHLSSSPHHPPPLTLLPLQVVLVPKSVPPPLTTPLPLLLPSHLVYEAVLVSCLYHASTVLPQRADDPQDVYLWVLLQNPLDPNVHSNKYASTTNTS